MPGAVGRFSSCIWLPLNMRLVCTKDDAVRGALVLENGEMMWPPPQLAVSYPLQ